MRKSGLNLGYMRTVWNKISAFSLTLFVICVWFKRPRRFFIYNCSTEKLNLKVRSF